MIKNKKKIISLYTIVRKEFFRILRIWPQTILPPIITSSIYFFIFGNIIGIKIELTNGYNYIQYITPGLIMMTMITNSYSNVVSSFFSSKFQKNIEEILISPTSNNIIIIGFIFGGFIRSFVVCFIVYAISTFFCNIYIYDLKIFILISITTSFIFSLLGLINAIFAKKFDDINIIPTFVLTPLIYLSGIFYSSELLPQELKILLTINPIFYIINIFRYSMLGISEISIEKSIYIIIILVIFLYIIIFYFLEKKKILIK